MRSAPRHSKPKKPISRLVVPTVAAAAVTGATAAFVFYPSGSAVPQAEHSGLPVTSAASGMADNRLQLDIHHQVASQTAREAARTARRQYLAAKAAAARRARQQAAARQAAAQQAAAQASASPTPSAAPSKRAATPRTRRWGCASATRKRAAATPGPGQRRRGLPVPAGHLGEVRRCGEPVRRRGPGLPGSDIRQRDRGRRRVELEPPTTAADPPANPTHYRDHDLGANRFTPKS